MQIARDQGIRRDFRSDDVRRLDGRVGVEHTLAKLGARRRWGRLSKPIARTSLGALTGNQAVQRVKAGLDAISLSGWQAAADANSAPQMFPDRSPCSASARRWHRYFDAVAVAISAGKTSTTAMGGSTEAVQFHRAKPRGEAAE